MSIALLAAFAQGAEIELLYADTFPQQLAGADGWVSGYAGDDWTGLASTEEAHPLSDDGSYGAVYGTGDAADNWLINTGIATMAEGGITAELDSEQDDTIGLVHSVSGGDTLYLAAWCGDVCPIGTTDGTERFYLLRIEGGVPVELARRNFAGYFGSFGIHVVDFVREDDPAGGGGHRLTITVDGTNAIDVVDPNPLPAGHAGFYAYNNGGCSSSTQCDTDFDDARIWALDEDDDTVADDLDNCEAVANADQLDTDADGIGDLCDDSPGTTTTTTEGDADTDADTDSDTDADTDADTDGDTDADTDTDTVDGGVTEGEILIVGSGCNATGTAALVGVAIGLALVASRRRGAAEPTPG